MKHFLYIIILITIHASLWTQAPATFSHSMTFNGETITVQFEKFSTRGPSFQVFEQVAGGNLNDVTTTFAEVRTYLGTVDGHPGALACAVHRDNGRPVQANVVFESGYQWFDQGGTVTDFTPVDTLVIPNFPTFQLRAGGAGTDLYSADIGMDVAHTVYNASGGSTAAAVEMAEFSLMVNNLPFIRDASVTNRLRRLVIRSDEASDPYTGGSVNLGDNAPWNVGPLVEDLLALASNAIGEPTAVGGFGDPGLSLQPAESTGEFGGTMRHEVGHNWGVGHQDGGQPEGKTISSGNELAKFSGPAIENILVRRDANLALLDLLGTLTTHNIPPRAADDIIIYEPGSGVNLTMNVLANDRDVNGSTISILSFDPVTQNGLPVSQNGQQLSVPLPSTFNNVPDRFKYRIQDASGQTSTAFVNILAQIPGEDLGHWTFKNENNRALDSGSKNNGMRLYGNAHINVGDELVLDGNADFGKAGPLGVTSNTITFSTFIYSNQTQVPEAGIIIGSDRYGIKFGDNNQLEFIWNEATRDAGVSIPNTTWTFLALVISPTVATIYILPEGGTLQTEVHNGTYSSIALTDELMFGDGGGADFDVIPPVLPYLNGRLDEIRIINRSLSSSDIQLLAEKKLGARDAMPYHTQSVPSGGTSITWSPSPAALNQRLFVSTDFNEVKNSSAGAEQGGITATTSTFQMSNASGSIFWKVETTESDNTIHSGSIWNFFAGDKNHSGSCEGLRNVCFGAEAPTGIATDGTSIYSVGTTGPLEANWVFQQVNGEGCGIPAQCFSQNSFSGNNTSHGAAFINGMMLSATSAGLTAYMHTVPTPCNEIWSNFGSYTGVTVIGTRLFAANGDAIEEINPADGNVLSSVSITGVNSVERLAAGTGATLYFSHYQSGTTGGVGTYDIDAETFALLPGAAGTGLLKPGGMALQSDGSLLIAEADARRIASIDAPTGTVTTLLDGLVAPRDVLQLGNTLYIADEGSDEIKSIVCSTTAGTCGLSNISTSPTFDCSGGMKTATITWTGNDASVTFMGGAGATPAAISAATGNTATFTYPPNQTFFSMILTDTEGFCAWSFSGIDGSDCTSTSCTDTGGSTCGSTGHPNVAGLYNSGNSSNTFSHGNNAMVGRTVFLCGGQSFCSTGATDGYGIDGDGSGTYFLAMGGDGVKSITFASSGSCGESWINTDESPTGVAYKSGRLFVSGGSEIIELDPANGTFIQFWDMSATISTGGQVARIENGPDNLLYFSDYNSAAIGGYGTLDIVTGASAKLLGSMGNMITRAVGMEYANGWLLAVERGEPGTGAGKIWAINPSAPSDPTEIASGFNDIFDVDYTTANGGNVLVADGGAGQIKNFACSLVNTPPSNCPPSYTAANGNRITGMSTASFDYETDGIIETEQMIISPHVIDYDSKISIEFLPTFEIGIGALLNAYIDGCGGSQ